jgi:hypothetical protein
MTGACSQYCMCAEQVRFACQPSISFMVMQCVHFLCAHTYVYVGVCLLYFRLCIDSHMGPTALIPVIPVFTQHVL